MDELNSARAEAKQLSRWLPLPAPQRVRRIQRTTISLLVTAGLINFLDRSSLSIANLTIRGELHLSATQIGALLSAFSLAYGLAQLPAGLLLDRAGTRLPLAAAMFLWSAAQLATGYVSSFASFLWLRAGLGIGEAPFMPGSVKAIHDWFPARARGLPMGMVNASTTLGQALAPPLLAALMLALGWRSMFIVIGLAGIVVSLAWYPLNRDRSDVSLTDHETAYLEESTAPETTQVALSQWFALFRNRTVLGMTLGFSGVNYTAWLYMAWLPGYLQSARHLSLAATGWAASVPFLLGSLGMLASGVAADYLASRGVVLITGRKALILTGMLCSAACTLAVTHAAATSTAVLSIGLALFFIHFAGTAAWGLVQIATPRALVASVGTIQNFGSFVCASVAPILTGWILDRTHSFSLSLAICALVTVLGAVSYLTLVHDAIRLR